MKDYNVENNILSLEELMDLVPPTATLFEPTNTPADKDIHMLEVNTEKQTVSELLLLHKNTMQIYGT